jgi:hypothetical protein
MGFDFHENCIKVAFSLRNPVRVTKIRFTAVAVQSPPWGRGRQALQKPAAVAHLFRFRRRRNFGRTAHKAKPKSSKCSVVSCIWTVSILMVINSPILVLNGSLSAR